MPLRARNQHHERWSRRIRQLKEKAPASCRPSVVRDRLHMRRHRTRGIPLYNGDPDHSTLSRAAAADLGAVVLVRVQFSDSLLPAHPCALQMKEFLRLRGKPDLAAPDVAPLIPFLCRFFL